MYISISLKYTTILYIGAEMTNWTYADIARAALSAAQTYTCEDESRLVRHLPTQRTGMEIVGQFEMFPSKDGGMVFIGENGQYIKK